MTNRIVWYHPVNFPTVLTDATLIIDNGDTLAVFNGREEITISAQQVERAVSARTHESSELLGQEMNEFDNQEKGI